MFVYYCWKKIPFAFFPLKSIIGKVWLLLYPDFHFIKWLWYKTVRLITGNGNEENNCNFLYLPKIYFGHAFVLRTHFQATGYPHIQKPRSIIFWPYYIPNENMLPVLGLCPPHDSVQHKPNNKVERAFQNFMETNKYSNCISLCTQWNCSQNYILTFKKTVECGRRWQTS